MTTFVNIEQLLILILQKIFGAVSYLSLNDYHNLFCRLSLVSSQSDTAGYKYKPVVSEIVLF